MKKTGTDYEDAFRSWLLSSAFTCAFVVIGALASGLIIGLFPHLGLSFLEVMLLLYDGTMLSIMIYIVWLDQSVDPRDQQDPLVYAFFLGFSLIPWTIKEDLGMSVLIVPWLVLLYIAFSRATTLRQRVYHS